MSKESDDFLAHHGILGMHWGTRKSRLAGQQHVAQSIAKTQRTPRDEVTSSDVYSKKILDSSSGQRKVSSSSSGRSGSSKSGINPRSSSSNSSRGMSKSSASAEADKYLAGPGANPSKKQQAKNLATNKSNFSAKFDPTHSTFKPKGKGGGIAGDIAAAALVGLIAYGAYKTRMPPPGTAVALEKYVGAVSMSQIKSWAGVGNGYIKKSSFKEAEFTLPAGHEFYRISTHPGETLFRNATYSVHNTEDFNRYVAAFRKEKGLTTPIHKVSFTSNKEIRVPNLQTRLDTLTEVMTAHNSKAPTKSEVMKQYNDMTGKNWRGTIDDKFLASLKVKGYHAIIDDMDAGVIGQSPLVLIDRHAFGEKSSVSMTEAAIKHAEANLTEINNRK